MSQLPEENLESILQGIGITNEDKYDIAYMAGYEDGKSRAIKDLKAPPTEWIKQRWFDTQINTVRTAIEDYIVDIQEGKL
jgi:hypothetical protein